MEMQSRGSDELLKEALRSGPRPIDDRMIEYLARKIRTIDVNDILVKGTPRPDWLKAVLLPGDAQAAGALAGELLQDLHREDKAVPVKISVLTRGIPWPEQFKVELEIGQGPA
ncbi:hypothetical protein LWF15_10000 [Kineosporia rhizophila]|uniref:hypothetical protein n=1 Tax=Kineosporia rhizophila TaxID=84633 RepID=UPI000B1D2AEC|nr:hypothetical protein [Kineosporia rhizophila]MCE0535844.1 hypothetical protein [Kineosporia rhizophila]